MRDERAGGVGGIGGRVVPAGGRERRAGWLGTGASSLDGKLLELSCWHGTYFTAVAHYLGPALEL